MPKRYTPTSAAADVEAALRLLEGRWKHFLSDVGYRSFQIGKAHHLASE